MKRLSFTLLFCFLPSGLVLAQENQTPYQIALQRIEVGRVQKVAET